MSRQYRALISVPIEANTDDEAWSQAVDYANLLRKPNHVIRGHVELVTEVADDVRRVWEDPGLRRQLPSVAT